MRTAHTRANLDKQVSSINDDPFRRASAPAVYVICLLLLICGWIQRKSIEIHFVIIIAVFIKFNFFFKKNLFVLVIHQIHQHASKSLFIIHFFIKLLSFSQTTTQPTHTKYAFDPRRFFSSFSVLLRQIQRSNTIRQTSDISTSSCFGTLPLSSSGTLMFTIDCSVAFMFIIVVFNVNRRRPVIQYD